MLERLAVGWWFQIDFFPCFYQKNLLFFLIVAQTRIFERDDRTMELPNHDNSGEGRR